MELERQRAALQRIYHHRSHMDSTVDLRRSLTPTVDQINDHHSRSCSADWQCNSSSPQPNPSKRKAEVDIEEEIGEQEEAAAEEKSDITGNNSSKGSKQDYIHVRARRGQATDSHSLAERARREKISKKMKSLQDLVPGCNKVTGKAGMLDEIINYVQSLQKQVEFLSMKLAVINPRLDLSIDNFFAKEIPAYIASAQLEATDSACFQYSQTQLGIPNCTMDQSHQILPQKELFLDASCISQLQQLSGWESDWQNLFPAGFP